MKEVGGVSFTVTVSKSLEFECQLFRFFSTICLRVYFNPPKSINMFSKRNGTCSIW